MIELAQGVAYNLEMGPFLLPADGNTPVINLTTAYTLVYLSKNGGALAHKAETTAIAHDLLGHYLVKVGTTDTDTLGTMRVVIHVAATHLPVWQDYNIITPAEWNHKYGTGKLAVDVDTIKTQAVTCAAGVTVLASVGTAAQNTAQTGDSFAKIGTLVNTGGTATIGAILGDMANSALVTRLGVGAAQATALAAIQAVTDYIATMYETDGAVKRWTQNALEQGPTGGSAPTAAAIRAEIDSNSVSLAAIRAITDNMDTEDGFLATLLGALLAGYTGTGTVGKALIDAAAGANHVTADYGEAQKQELDDWVNGGRLDLIIDALATATALATLQSDFNALATTDDVANAVALQTTIAALIELLNHYIEGGLAFTPNTPSAGYTQMQQLDKDTDAVVFTQTITDATGSRSKAV